MASVHLTFQPPDEPNITHLHIEEAPAKTGPFAEIENVTPVGVYPDYMTEFTCNLAVNALDWFRIRWEDDKGAFTAYSQPFPGGSTTLIGQIVRRVRERDTSLNVQVVIQEAEAAIQMHFGESVDPYDTTLVASYRVLNGLTYLVMARAIIARTLLTQNTASATIGLVSWRKDTTVQNRADVQQLLDLANKELGIGTSLVLQLEEVQQRMLTPTWQAQYNSIPWVILGRNG